MQLSTDTENNIKVGISDQHLRPDIAILDPTLTVNLPPYITACTGIDALAHALEAYLAKDSKYIQAEGEILFQGSTPMSDALALEAIERISTNLITAVHQGNNLEARANMLLGSLLAGMAFSNAGTAAAHALAYPIGGLVKSPHGEVVGILLPYVIQFNAMLNKRKMRRVAESMQLKTEDMNETDLNGAVTDQILQLLRNIGLPCKLSSIGVQEDDLSVIASKALTIDRIMRNNPRHATQSAFTELLRKAL